MKCSHCEQEKELTSFSTYNTKTGKKHRKCCKSCFNAKYNATHYQNNKPRYILNARKQKVENRDFVRDIKEKNGCIRCGETKYWRLAFHHLGDKEFTISKRISSRKRLEQEIAKCIVVCHNCHADIHHEERNNAL